MNELFSGIVQVEIQGKRVLRFLGQTGNQTSYEVIGFEHSSISLNDTRYQSLLAIQELLETGDLNSFASKFNRPAYLRLLQDEAGQILIELHETKQHPNYMLWIAIGLGNTLPVYDYVYENIASLHPEAGYAFIGLYHLPEAERSPRLSREPLSTRCSVSLPALVE